MYQHYYGFTEEPFRLSPDSRLCFRHASYKKAKAYMQYALERREGFVMVTGRPGTGKSTLISDLTRDLEAQGNPYASLTCTQIEADDLLRLVAFGLGLKGDSQHKAQVINDLHKYFERLQREDRRPLLIIDEAQDLSADALEELRLLTNLQQENQPLLQIFLVGQEELKSTVLQPGLEQLHQRIVAACNLQPLDLETMREYILHRLKHVGWNGNPEFDESVFPAIHQHSLGIPRVINQVCSRLLLHGMVEERSQLGAEDIAEALDGLSAEQLLPASRTTVSA